MNTNNDIRSIIEQLKSEILPIGCILMFPSEKVPKGFLPCDGSELSKRAYPELYSIMGSTFGETKDSFFLPDLQGQFVRGWDKEGDVDPDRKFGSEQADSMQGHSHELHMSSYSTSAEGAHSHEILADGRKTFAGGSNERGVISTQFHDLQGGKTTTNGIHTHSLPEIRIKDPINSTYGIVKYSNETRPRNIALSFCVKVK